MSVANIECQIAKAQLGRYLVGETMDPEIVQQLEAHVARCPECKADLAAKRASLLAEINEAAAERTHPAPEEIPASPAQSLVDMIHRRTGPSTTKAVIDEAPNGPTASKLSKAQPFWKPIAYSAVLGVVLIGMSFAGKNGSNLFGANAATAIPDKVADKQPVATKPETTTPVSSSTTTDKTLAKNDSTTNPVDDGSIADNTITKTAVASAKVGLDAPAVDTTTTATTPDTKTPATTGSVTPDKKVETPTAKADTAVKTPPVAKPDAKVEPKTEVKSTPKTATPKADVKPAANAPVKKTSVPKTPVVAKKVTPKVKPAARVVRRPVAKKAVRRVVKAKVHAPKPSHGIRVYDAAGHAIN